MPIIPVIVNDIYHTHALLDIGSSDTFCSKHPAYAIGGQGYTTTYTLNTLNATEDVTSEIVQFSLSSEYNTETFNMNNVRVIKQIPTRGISCDIPHYPHLRGITCPGDVRVDILIGQDNPAILLPIDVRTGKHNEPFAVRGVLGWTLNGPVHSQRPSKCVINNLVSTISIEKLDSLYKLNDFDDDLHIPPEDDQVMTLCNQRGKVTDGHIELPIPWNNDAKILPDKRYIPESRLRNLLKLLTKRNLFDRYDVQIKKLLHNRYTESIPHDAIIHKAGVYLPHRTVINNTEKLHVILDCVSQCQGASLNSVCLQGHTLPNRLFDILLKFRQFPHGVMADITAMYNQIQILLEDQDALCFLWVDDDTIVKYCMTSSGVLVHQHTRSTRRKKLHPLSLSAA